MPLIYIFRALCFLSCLWIVPPSLIERNLFILMPLESVKGIRMVNDLIPLEHIGHSGFILLCTFLFM